MLGSALRRRTALVVGSIGLHAIVFASISAIPVEAPREDDGAWAPIEVVVWDPPTAAPTPAPVVVDEVTPVVVSAPVVDAAVPAKRSRAARPSAGTPTTTPTPTPTTTTTTTTTTTPPPAPAPATAGGPIALQGVGHVTAPGTVTSPRLDAGAMRSLDAKGPSPSGPQPRAPAGGGGDGDGAPRTLADAGFTRDKRGNYTYREPAGHFTAKLLPDGRVRFKDHLVKASPIGVKMPDLYSVVSKAQHHELWARQKTQLLEQTFELRLAIAVGFAERQIDARIKNLHRELLEVWGAPDRPADLRRKTLFERWDDCDERMRVTVPGFEDVETTKIDAVRLDAAGRARTTIVEFVRKHLPEGSDDAFGADELARLNRGRHSAEKFAPYAKG